MKKENKQSRVYEYTYDEATVKVQTIWYNPCGPDEVNVNIYPHDCSERQTMRLARGLFETYEDLAKRAYCQWAGKPEPIRPGLR